MSLIIFPESASLHYVLFVIGVCLIGGVSDFWTASLEGNLDLSITMSMVNSLLACGKLSLSLLLILKRNLKIIVNNFYMTGVIPIWILTLGHALAHETEYRMNFTYFIWNLCLLITPFCIGTLLQLCCSRISKCSMQILRIFSPIYLLSIVIYAYCKSMDLLAIHIILSFTWKVCYTTLFSIKF